MIDFSKFLFKKAIVTGGAGFIGSHIVEELVTNGIETISVDNYYAGKEENLEHLKKYPHFHEVKCDVLDFDGLEKLFPGVDVVFHQAASKKTICLNNPRLDLEINAKGTFNMLELAVKHGVKKFVHASTGSVYGEAEYMPQDERHQLNPTSYYGVSKLAGEKYVRAFHHLYGLSVAVLRYFHVYGPRQESSDVGGVVSIFTRRIMEGKPIYIYGDGTQQRTFTYVKDVVNANILSAMNDNTNGQVYNCASGIKVTIEELYKLVCDILGKPNHPLEYKNWMPGDIKVFDINNGKIKQDLGIEFVIDFRAGLNLTVNWAKEYYSRKGGF